MNNMLVSVVIPVYNDSEYLPSAINSVINQTYENMEIIIVDDGSEENIEQIKESYICREEVRFIHHSENKGLPAARNTGIKESNGDLIAFLDADDEWIAEKVGHQVKQYSDRPELGMIYTDFYRVYEDGSKSLGKAIDSSKENLSKDFFIRGGSILPSSVVIPRDVFNKVGTFDERLKNAQETDMWIRVMAEYPIRRLEKPLVKRSVREDSLGSNYNEKFKYQNIVTEKSISAYPELSKYKEKREGYLLSNRATYRLSTGDTKKARQDAIASIRRYPTLLRPYLVASISILPSNLAKTIFKKVKLVVNT